MSTPTTKLSQELVRTACTAPSVHNTQPWAWRISEDACVVDLYADRSRQLPGTDPSGRDLAISCGAALHHLQVAATAFGLEASSTLMPDRADPDLLARTVLSPGSATEHDVALLAALENRHTDRRGFTDWEVPLTRLEHLADAASGPAVRVSVLSDPRHLARAEELIEQARSSQLRDASVAEELDQWTGHTSGDGIPPDLAQPAHRPGSAPRADRFSRRRPVPADSDHGERSDALMVVCTGRDDQRAWLRAGQALSALWVQASLEGLSVTPQSQVTEVRSTRAMLRRDVFRDMARPQIVVRVGWQEINRPQLERTPRRALEDVLLP